MRYIERVHVFYNAIKPERRAHLAAVTCILIFNVGLFHPLIRHNLTFGMVASHMFAQYPWAAVTVNDQSFQGQGLPQKDFAERIYPSAVAATYAVQHGEFPIWDPWSLGGTPELSMTGHLYPPRLAAMRFLPAIWQHDLLLMFHLLLAGLGQYALLRYWGANAWGAVLAAFVWELNSHNSLYMILESTPVMSALLPWALLSAAATVRTRSFPLAVVTGCLAGWLILAGHLQWAAMSCFILLLCYGAMVFRTARDERDKTRSRRLYFLPAVSALVCILMSAVIWMPLLAWLPSLHRAWTGMDIQRAHSGAWREVVKSLLFPEKSFQANAQTCAFVSVTALILAPLALLRRNGMAWLMGALALGSFLLLIGFYPVVLLLRTLPFGSAFVLDRSLYMFCFALSILAGFGLSEVTALLADGSLKTPRMIFGSTVIVLAAVELLVFSRVITPLQSREARWLYPETPLIAKLKELEGSYQSLPFYYRGSTWAPGMLIGDVPEAFQLRSVGGDCTLAPNALALLWKTVERGGVPASNNDLDDVVRPVFAHDLLPAAMLERISVKYLISGPGLLPADPKLGPLVATGRAKVVYDGPDGRIFELPRALPRAYVVPSVKQVANAQTALMELAGGETDFSKVALVSGNEPEFSIAVPDPAALKAAITHNDVDSVDVQVSTPVHSMLVLNDSWAPGWNVTVDGQPSTVQCVNFAYRGVDLPPGDHAVSFVYKPTSVYVGLWLEALASLLMLAAALRWLQLTFRKPDSSGTGTPSCAGPVK